MFICQHKHVIPGRLHSRHGNLPPHTSQQLRRRLVAAILGPSVPSTAPPDLRSDLAPTRVPVRNGVGREHQGDSAREPYWRLVFAPAFDAVPAAAGTALRQPVRVPVLPGGTSCCGVGATACCAARWYRLCRACRGVRSRVLVCAPSVRLRRQPQSRVNRVLCACLCRPVVCARLLCLRWHRVPPRLEGAHRA